jgi:hypothetical protein
VLGQVKAAPVRLFTPAATPVRTVIPLQAGAMPVEIDRGRLEELQTDDRVLLTLSSATEIEGVVRRVEHRGRGRFSVFGNVGQGPASFFIIAVEPDATAAVFQTPLLGTSYRLTHLADGVSQIVPIDPASYPECGLGPNAGGGRPDRASIQSDPGPAEDDHTGEGDGGSQRGGCSAPARNFDVIIAYTQTALNEVGGASQIQAQAQLAVDTANQTYEDSQINPRITLLFTKQVPYNESTNMADDRDALTDPNDSVMDVLHDDRDEFGADFVCLFVGNVDTNACGIAHCTPSGADQGFCVVQQSCAVGSFSFAHEIGHLQGCAHDYWNAGIGCSEFCYSYGWRFFGDSGAGWRTVMAYDNNNNDYTRIGIFSNPNVNFDGEPCGNDNNPCIINEHNARTVNNTAADREGWRAPKCDVWVEALAPVPWFGTFQDPWPTVLIGVAAVYDGTRTPLVQPELHIKAGTYNETMTIDKPMTIRSCGGAATIGR